MRYETMPMVVGVGQHVGLAHVLSVLPGGLDLEWALLDFYGVGVAPDGLRMDDFERLARESPLGYRFAWPDLVAFAAGLDETRDCLLVGVHAITGDEATGWSTDDFSRCQVVIEGDDSTRWRVAVDPTLMAPEQLSHGLLNVADLVATSRVDDPRSVRGPSHPLKPPEGALGC